MNAVWKFQLPEVASGPDSFDIEVPTGAAALHLGRTSAYDPPCLWMLVDPTQPTESRGYRWAGTGHLLDDGHEHVGTLIEPPFVWHLFHWPQT